MQASIARGVPLRWVQCISRGMETPCEMPAGKAFASCDWPSGAATLRESRRAGGESQLSSSSSRRKGKGSWPWVPCWWCLVWLTDWLSVLTDRLPACRPTMLLCGGGWCLGWRSGGAREAPVLFYFLGDCIGIGIGIDIDIGIEKQKNLAVCDSLALFRWNAVHLQLIHFCQRSSSNTSAKRLFYFFFFFLKKNSNHFTCQLDASSQGQFMGHLGVYIL